MKIEYEVRILNADFKTLMKKVCELGARKVGMYHQKRYVYDFMPAQKGRWIRLRTNGTNTTLTVKEVKSSGIDGTEELEVAVSEFDNMNAILQKLGYFPRNYQENFRIEYTLDGVNFDFDIWPKIPVYLEIEALSEQAVLSAIEKMGIPLEQVTTMNIETVYKTQYQIDLDMIKSLKFSEEELNFIALYENEEE